MQYKKTILLFCFTVNCMIVFSQQQFNDTLLKQLKQIENSNNLGSPFAKLYYNAILKSNTYLTQLKKNEQQFVVSFENKFAPLFFTADSNYKSQKPVSKVWGYYYKANKANASQLEFMGLNAHINGDMWHALQQLPYDTLKRYSKMLRSFQNKFDEFWSENYKQKMQYKKVRLLHTLSLGLTKNMGKKLIKKWRYKAIEIALLYTTNPIKYKRLVNRNVKTLHRWNRFAMHWIK